MRRQRRVREQQAAERARQARFDALAEREEQVWTQILDLLAQRKASGYEQAVAHLAELRDLAVHRKQRPAFDERLTDLLKLYPPSPALQRRLREHKLITQKYRSGIHPRSHAKMREVYRKRSLSSA